MSIAFKFQQIRTFKFWFNQALHEGMQYDSDLFQQVRIVNYGQRQQLYQQAAQLTQSGADIIITCNEQDCNLWLNLKFQTRPTSVSGKPEAEYLLTTSAKDSSTHWQPSESTTAQK